MNRHGFVGVELIAVTFLIIAALIAMKVHLKLKHRITPEVAAKMRCEKEMEVAVSFFSGLFQGQNELPAIALNSSINASDTKALDQFLYTPSKTAARNIASTWFDSPLAVRPSAKTPAFNLLILTPAQLVLDETNLAQNLFNQDPRYCTEPYGLNTLAGKSIRTWLAAGIADEAEDIFLKIEPVSALGTFQNQGACFSPVRSAVPSGGSKVDPNRSGFAIYGNPNLSFKLTWTSVKKNQAGKNQADCQASKTVAHEALNSPPASPILMSMTNGNGSSLLDPDRAFTTCDSEEGQFNEVKMSWDFDKAVTPGTLALCRTWTIFGETDGKTDIKTAGTSFTPRFHQSSLPMATQKYLPRSRLPASGSGALNPNSAGVKIKTNLSDWNLCSESKFNVGAQEIPVQLSTIFISATSTAPATASLKMKILNLPKQDVEYYVETKLVDPAGNSSSRSSIAHFVVDVNRPGILEVNTTKDENAVMTAFVSGPNPGNFRNCQLVSSDIPNATSCYDGEKCLIRAPKVPMGAHQAQIRARDVCGKLSTTANFQFNQIENRQTASVTSLSVTPQTELANAAAAGAISNAGVPPAPASSNRCVRPTLRNLEVRCKKNDTWTAWSKNEYPTPEKDSETNLCEIRYYVFGASHVEHHGVYDVVTRQDYKYDVAQPTAWTQVTENFPVGYTNPKTFFRSEYPIFLSPTANCLDDQIYTFELSTHCQQGTCQFKPSLSANTCASN